MDRKHSSSSAANRVRSVRIRAGLSQLDVAQAVGVTRQSLSSIEAGRATPSVTLALRLARVLRIGIEELFGDPPDAESITAETSSELAGRVAAAQIAGRWVAHRLTAADAARCADAVASPGTRERAPIELLHSAERAREVVLLMGCAPALGVLAERLSSRPGPGWFRWLHRSSSAALDELFARRTHVAGIHWADVRGADANVAEIRRRKVDVDLAVVTLAHWEVGLVFARGNPQRINSVSDLARPPLRIAVREVGSGARRMLEQHIKQVGRSAAVLRGPKTIAARGHLEVAAAIALGAADVGAATHDAARAYGLGFLPLARERFDLVLPAALVKEPRTARMLDVLTSGAWRREITALGYDAAQSGDVVAQLRAA